MTFTEAVEVIKAQAGRDYIVRYHLPVYEPDAYGFRKVVDHSDGFMRIRAYDAADAVTQFKLITEQRDLEPEMITVEPAQ